MRPFLTCLLLTACADPKEEASPTPHYIWAGWNHTWSQLSHRVSFIRAIATPSAGLQMGIRGGDWSTGDTWADEANYRMHLQAITGGDLQVVHGETDLTIGPSESASTTAEVDIDADSIVVMLRGFEIETDTEQVADYPDYDPSLGYTSRGFGMSVGNVDTSQGVPAFDVGATVRWGPRDRDDMNAALEVAQTEVRVAWTAIGFSGTTQQARLSDAIDLPHAPPWSEQSGLTLDTGWTGGPGITGIAAFDLQVSEQDGGQGGDYLRSFGVEVDLEDDGAAPGTLQTEVLTTSAIELGKMHFAPQIDLLWLSPDASNVAVRPITMSGTHPVGTTDVHSDE